jgi:hypothetical protein
MAFLRRVELRFWEQIATEGGDRDRRYNCDPGGEENGTGVEEECVGCHESLVAALILVAKILMPKILIAKIKGATRGRGQPASRRRRTLGKI